MQTVIDTFTPGKPGFQQSDIGDLKGMVVLVTGGTGGIGFEVARTFALSGARVLILSRKAEHGDEALQKIQNTASDDPVDVDFVECDLGNLQNVKDVADKIREEEKRLDIVVAATGVGVNKFDVTSDGIDRHFGVNHLGHFLLINRLFPLIRRTSKDHSNRPPRIVSVSSELYRVASPDIKFESPIEITDKAKDMSAVDLYARSKLANILFTKYVLEKVIRSNGDRIFALATHPGAVYTGQQDQFKEAYGPALGSILKTITVPFMRSPEQGSLSTLWAATSDDVERSAMQGYYFTDPSTPGDLLPQACDEKLGQNLWNVSELLVREKLGEDGLLPWNERME